MDGVVNVAFCLFLECAESVRFGAERGATIGGCSEMQWVRVLVCVCVCVCVCSVCLLLYLAVVHVCPKMSE